MVRQVCGFGCVICGSSIVEYEHVDPPFAEAMVHDPSNIALLCPQCHGKVTAGFWTKDRVAAAIAAPCSKQQGFSSEIFELGKSHPTVGFGGVAIRNCEVPILVHDLPPFEVQTAEEAGAPFRLSAYFFTSTGVPSLEIHSNEWFAHATNWDVEVTGRVITVRDAPGHVSLQLEANPPTGLTVRTTDMYAYGYRFRGSSDTLRVTSPGGGTSTFTSCIADNCRAGMSFG